MKQWVMVTLSIAVQIVDITEDLKPFLQKRCDFFPTL